jgi:hypothetical protein
MSSKSVRRKSPTDSVRRQCPSCGERVSITQRGNWRCPACTLAFCPFCKKSLLDRCEHVVASWTDDAGWNYSPFERAPLPEVPEELEGLATTSEDWPSVFGENAASVIKDAYTNYGELGWKPELEDEPSLFLWMLERQGLSCDSSSWEVPSWFFSSFGNDYFSQERDRIYAAIREEVAWLAAGLEQLFTILRARHKQPEKPTGFRSLPADDPIYKEGWTVFTPHGWRDGSKKPGTSTLRKPSPSTDKSK